MHHGRWEQTGDEPGNNINKNPHFTGCMPPRCDSVMPDSTGLPDANFVYFYHPDHLGSTAFVTDKEGELYEHVLYFPFGETWAQEASNKERLPYLFTAKELDEETQLYYFGARYYDPRTSVWGSTDPVLGDRLADPNQGLLSSFGLGVYSYTRLNPLRLVDPDGRQEDEADAVLREYKKIRGAQARATKEGVKKIEPVAEAAAGAVPGVGAAEALTGELATGRKLSDEERAVAGGASALGPLARIFRWVGEALGIVRPLGKSVDDILEGASRGRLTKGRTRQFDKPGGWQQANRDFDALAPSDVTDLPGGGRMGTLSDGRTVIVRPTSTGKGPPTLEIQKGKARIKIRFTD